MEFIKKGNIDAKRKVLIARTVGNTFRHRVITKVIEALGTKDYYFKNIKLRHLSKEYTDQYGVILLVTAHRTNQINTFVKRFVKKNNHNSKVIIFYTVNSEIENMCVDNPKLYVDAICSASLSDLVNKRADQLVELIEKKFSTNF